MSELIQLGRRHERPKAPQPSQLELRFSEAAIKELDALRTHYPEEKACILPGLWIAQREYDGYLSPEAIAEVAYRLHRSYAEVEGVATFYSLYNTAHRPGKHKIELCTCLSCHVNDAWSLRAHIKERLGIGHGETTADGMFTFEEVECLNACDRAPVMQVGDEYLGPMDVAAVDALLDRLRGTDESTVTRYANTVVSVQLQRNETS
jgi:NADH-quinone oxidoreductase subunit E